MREFVCFKWKPARGYRSEFGPETVNTLHSMIGRNHDGPFRLTCITDDARGISKEVRVLPLWTDLSHLPSPHGNGYPSCYRRLRLFADDVAELIGERFVVLDLDVVICAKLNPLYDGGEDFKIWGDTARGTPYNGSMWMLKAGARRKVWDEFDPVLSPKRSLALGYIGSDQGWIGAALGPGEAKWGTADGVYSFRNHIQRTGGRLPPNARVVIFHGAIDPWSAQARFFQWVCKHYR